jgi:hypothetical protein
MRIRVFMAASAAFFLVGCADAADAPVAGDRLPESATSSRGTSPRT